MSVLDATFTAEELQPVRAGIRKFIRLLGLISHPLHCNWLADEWDLTSSLLSIPLSFARTEPLIGKRMYQGRDFDVCQSVRRDLRTFLLTGVTEAGDVNARRQYLPMYYLVIEPVINLFSKFDHRTAIDVSDAVINSVIELVDQSTDYGTYDDALVAYAQTRQMIELYEAQQKAEHAARRKPNRRRKNLFVDIPNENPIEEEQEGESLFDQMFE